MTATYENIATTTLSSAAGTITFNSIGSGYTDLRVVMVGTMVTTEQPFLRFNSDTGTNYSSTFLFGNGTSAGSARFTNGNRIWIAPLSNWSTTNAQMATIDIFSYAGSTNKTVLCAGTNDNNGSSGLDRSVGLWRNTAAITRIDIIGNNQNFSAGFTATLFGIKAE